MSTTQNHSLLMNAYADMNAGRYEKARQTFSQLADAGEHQALVYLGWMDEQGLGGLPNEQQAELRYKSSAESGDCIASYYYGCLKLKQGALDEALVLFSSAAENGHPSAAYWVSALYGGEKGYPKNREMEIIYLEKAASLGHVYARRDIARNRIRESNYFIERLWNRLRYFSEKLKGIYLTAKNHQDPRVR